MAKTPRTDGPFPQNADRPSARKRIFDTASELFYRKGIRAVGVETIAEEAKPTKMSLSRSSPSKDELVAEWLRDHDIKFWQTWDATSRKFPANARKQLKAAFTLLAKHVVDPHARGCPMANAAVELSDKDHPARKGSEAHKAKLRIRLAEMCARLGARQPRLLARQPFLLMERVEVSTQLLGVHRPPRDVAIAAESVIEA